MLGEPARLPPIDSGWIHEAIYPEDLDGVRGTFTVADLRVILELAILTLGSGPSPQPWPLVSSTPCSRHGAK